VASSDFETLDFPFLGQQQRKSPEEYYCIVWNGTGINFSRVTGESKIKQDDDFFESL
jgi:hypothetical protein